MPTYEYECERGHRFERFQRITEEPLKECPECGAPAERLLSPGAGLLFKGSGFYITDYRSEGYRKAAEKEKGGSGAGESKDAGTGGGASDSKASSAGGGESAAAD